MMIFRRKSLLNLLKKEILIDSFDLGGVISVINKAKPSSFNKIIKPKYSTAPSGSTTSSVFDPSNTGHSYICSKNYSEYFQVSFNKVSVYVTGYKIRSETYVSHLRSWNFSGSNDGNQWTTLHYNWKNEVINSPSTEYSFTCDKTGLYKHFRILQTGLSSANGNCIAFSQIDLIGSALFDACKTVTQNRSFSKMYSIIIMLICLW